MKAKPPDGKPKTPEIIHLGCESHPMPGDGSEPRAGKDAGSSTASSTPTASAASPTPRQRNLDDENYDPIPTFRAAMRILFGINALLVTGIVLALCPPWRETFRARGVSSVKPLGHAVLWSPPRSRYASPAVGVEIDYGRLILQFGALVGVGILARSMRR